MPTRELLTSAQRLRFAEIPADLDDRLMARHHTLSKFELAAIRKRRGPENRLGFGVQLALLKYPGRPLRPAQRVPEKIVRFVASQIGVDPVAMDAYARGRDTTRREHLSEIIKTFGFMPFDTARYRELSRWLMQVAGGTDSGPALVEAVLAEIRRRKVAVPGIYTVERLAWESRRRARDEKGLVLEGVAGAGGLQLIAREDGEGEPELGGEFVLPLLHQVPGRDDQAPLQVAPDHELLY